MKDRIKKIRKEKDLTQQEFASKIGTSQNVLANYEIGRRNPSASVINNICKTFNVNESWLRNGTGEMFVEQSPDEPPINIINVLTSLDEDDWKLLFHTAFALAKKKEMMHDE